MSFELLISVLALTISLISVFVSGYYSHLSIKTNIRPTLVFVYSQTGWSLRNVGSGPALNVLVAHKIPRDTQWQKPTRVYPIRANDEVKIAWVGHGPQALGVTYQDANNVVYTSICEDDLTKLYERNELSNWDEAEIIRVWQH